MPNGIFITQTGISSYSVEDGKANINKSISIGTSGFTHENPTGYYTIYGKLVGSILCVNSNLKKINVVIKNGDTIIYKSDVTTTYQNDNGSGSYEYSIDCSWTATSIKLTYGNTYSFSYSTSGVIIQSSALTFTVSSITLVSLTNSADTIAIGTIRGNVYKGTTNIGCASAGNGVIVSIGAAGTPIAYATTYTSGFTAASDKRDKADFKTIDNSLKFINQLQPVTFVDNHREKYTSYDDENNKYFNEELYNNQTLKGNRRIAGFIAQDVYKSLIDVYNDDNYASVVDYSKYDDPDSDIDRYYMRYTQIIPFLTGAIQELTKKIETLENRISELENK